MALRAPPIDFDAIRAAIWQGVQDATGLGPNSVVVSQPEAPIAKRPETPFCEFMVTTVAQSFGEDYEVADAEDGVFRYVGPRMMTVQFQTYGETHEQAYGLACCLHAALQADPICDLLKSVGVVVWRRDAVIDLSALLSTGYEGRAGFNASFGLHSSLSLTVGTIASVPVSAAITSDALLDRADFTVDLEG
jgi:hypothetical protein